MQNLNGQFGPCNSYSGHDHCPPRDKNRCMPHGGIKHGFCGITVAEAVGGDVLSIGCGSGLMESILKRDFGIVVTDGVEPSPGMADELLDRQPFSGPGLGVRILGEVTEEKVKLLQQADLRVQEEVRKLLDYKTIWQTFAVPHHQ